ncbi:MAG: cold shock domain-containing protein [Candidatus Cloacimonetes bacterium]|nr:cold shock domain-containing protein [Candidatus Cloacimonadota bacterium]
MLQGKVKWFNEQKGFGFISSEDGNDYFLHHSAIVDGNSRSIYEGAEVQFESENSDKGLRAVQVSII